MQKLTPYQSAMAYQKRLDEKSTEPLPTVEQFIRMTGVTKDIPDSVEALKQLCREALYVHEGLSQDKRQLFTATLKTLENGTHK